MKFVKLTVVLRVMVALVFAAGALSGCGKGDDKKEDKDTKKITIGIVSLASSLDNLVTGYKTAMGELGYVEGKDITYIYNGAVGEVELLNAEVQKMVDAKVDLVLAISTTAAVAAKEVTAGTNIPVLFFPSADPVGAGIVSDLQHPGGNITGIMSGQSASKELEWLTKIVPTIKRVYAPYNPDDRGPSNTIKVVTEDAKLLGVELVTVETRTREEVLAAMDTMPDDIDAILIIADSLVGAQITDLVAFAIEKKLPLASSSKTFAEVGALMGYGGDQFEISRQAARQSQQILKGTPPGDLPVETADSYLSLNLVTAEAIGITIPDIPLNAAKDIIRE
ncbi:MAG TPA: ABC transporter substrate-binding protein [Aggregatilineaceae bacterium]|nr:ABC transporter substrate-binding protein [Aggregatilineaceae bacterium]